jgi:phosphate transport system permease protein
LAPTGFGARLARGLDRGFRWSTTSAGVLILAVLGAVAAFWVVKAWPAVAMGGAQLRVQVSWLGQATSLAGFAGPRVFGTLLAAALALALAVPVAIGVALFITQYAPRRLAAVLGYAVDLLAAVPSVVYGLWGALVLPAALVPVWGWLARQVGWFPLFAGPASVTGRTMATVAVVLAVMILPIVTAVSREVFGAVPALHTEAALALGATRWETIRTAVLPFGRSGVISAAMLGLGRALGETMAVLMILSPGFVYSLAVLRAGQQQTIAANIAAQFPEANPAGVSALIATGLVLFVITMLVNIGARAIIARRKDFRGADA